VLRVVCFSCPCEAVQQHTKLLVNGSEINCTIFKQYYFNKPSKTIEKNIIIYLSELLYIHFDPNYPRKTQFARC